MLAVAGPGARKSPLEHLQLSLAAFAPGSGGPGSSSSPHGDSLALVDGVPSSASGLVVGARSPLEGGTFPFGFLDLIGLPDAETASVAPNVYLDTASMVWLVILWVVSAVYGILLVGRSLAAVVSTTAFATVLMFRVAMPDPIRMLPLV